MTDKEKEMVVPRNREREFALQELFFSTTDTRGLILDGNGVFVRVSGYARGELLGQPHNIIRHPDMPRVVFKLLWDTIEQGKTIAAYVKNMAKTGEYYWVIAVVSPIPNGYISIRFKPTGKFFSLVAGVYEDLLSVERQIENAGGERKDAMAASSTRLGELLGAHGLKSYDELVWAFVADEIRTRASTLEQQQTSDTAKGGSKGVVAEICSQIEAALSTIFQRIEPLQAVAECLQKESRFVGELADAIRMTSVNALVEATRLDRAGATLSVIAEAMARYADNVGTIMPKLYGKSNELLPLLSQAIFEVCISKLKIEMATFFNKEEETQTNQEHSSKNIDTLLTHSFAPNFAQTIVLLSKVADMLNSLEEQVLLFEDIIKKLEFTQLNGRVEASRLESHSGFDTILSQVARRAAEARNRLGRFRSELSSSAASLRGISQCDSTVRRALASLRRSLVTTTVMSEVSQVAPMS